MHYMQLAPCLYPLPLYTRILSNTLSLFNHTVPTLSPLLNVKETPT